jgi:hypothetical protein
VRTREDWARAVRRAAAEARETERKRRRESGMVDLAVERSRIALQR